MRPRPKTQAQVFSKKKGLQKFFSGNLKEKKVSKKCFRKCKKKDLEKKFSADLQTFTNSKNSAVLEPRTGQFLRLEASKPRASKCVLEAKDILEDSISGMQT